jgi:hypothetical protein
VCAFRGYGRYLSLPRRHSTHCAHGLESGVNRREHCGLPAGWHNHAFAIQLGVVRTGALDTTQGLPTSGSFVSVFNTNVTFQFQPYTSNNALYTGGTLTLVTPEATGYLAFLSSDQGGGTFTATLDFSDGTTYTLPTASDPDWTTSGVTDVALANSGVVQDDSTWVPNYNGTLSL